MSLGFKNLLIVSPHPDDSEYSCFGAIKKFKAKTTILICSSGGAGDLTNKKDRLEEVVEFWKEEPLGVKILQENLSEMPYHESVEYLDKLIEKHNFDAVFVTPEEDSNQEHRRISQLIKSSLRDKSPALLEYWTPSTNHGWKPNIWISLDKNLLDLKVNLLISSFKSQAKKSYFKKEYIESFHNDWQASKRGIPFCEKFKLISWMGS